MSEKRFVQCEIEYGFANTTNIKKIDGVYDMQEEKTYRIEQIVDKLNEQQATIKQLESDKAIAEDYANIFEKENVKLRKQIDEQQATISKLEEEKGYWKSKAMTLLMQVRRLTPRMSAKEVIEFGKELEE